MNKNLLSGIAATTFVASLAFAAPASAAVTFDPATGTGFVGKGDVQLQMGWNNAQLQNNVGNVSFKVPSVSVTENTWTCDKDSGPQTQEKERTVTTTNSEVVSSVARERNQITGFKLTGYGTPVVESVTTDGPPLHSCPNGWTAIDKVTSEPVVTPGETLYLYVSGTKIGAIN